MCCTLPYFATISVVKPTLQCFVSLQDITFLCYECFSQNVRKWGEKASLCAEGKTIKNSHVISTVHRGQICIEAEVEPNWWQI